MTPSDGVERVESLERLRELEPLLEDLFRRDPCATPFQSPAWLLPWVECFAAGAALRCLVVFAAGRAVVALPLMLAEHEFGERGAERCLRWIGHGLSDRLDALVDPLAPAPALECARRALGELWAEVERLELDELPSAEPPHGLWCKLEQTRLEPAAVCPVLPLRRAGSELEPALPGWLRRNLRQTERRLETLGRIEWRSARATESAAAANAAADAAPLAGLVAAFMELHSARWRARGQQGVLADPRVQAFHRAAAPRLIERGLLALDVLYLDQTPLAATYVLRRADAHLYLFGFDPSLPRLSLGSLAIWRSIGQARDAGLGSYDFLRGSEPYKYAFGASNRQSYRCVGVRASRQALRWAQPRV
jgi:CelD/BcsL family acetyltransferase involved in cellulose biosynthesis